MDEYKTYVSCPNCHATKDVTINWDDLNGPHKCRCEECGQALIFTPVLDIQVEKHKPETDK